MTGQVSFETLWNALSHPAIATDGDGKIVAFNAAAEQFFSVSARSMTGHSVAEFAPEGSRLATLIEQARRDGTSLSERDVEVRRVDSEARLAEVQVSPINDESNSSSLLIVMQKGSIAEKMNRSLAHRGAARSVTGMAAALSHEIRRLQLAVVSQRKA